VTRAAPFPRHAQVRPQIDELVEMTWDARWEERIRKVNNASAALAVALGCSVSAAGGWYVRDLLKWVA